MLVVASNQIGKQKIYHRLGCIYAKRIKIENRREMSGDQARKRGFQECKYCAGLLGDVREHKGTIPKWEQKYQMEITYKKPVDTLYISTSIGFWKIYQKREIGKYLLYHRNKYFSGMEFERAAAGEFHRQADAKPTESLSALIDYIGAHDRAKVTILEDYRKLPQQTKKQKKYYKAAEKKAKKREQQRVDDLFALLESSRAGMLQYSFC